MTTKNQSSATGEPTITKVGIFPFKTHSSLTKRELKWFEDQASQRINAVLPLYKLAKKIAVDENINENDALAIVQNLGDEFNRKYAFTYLEDLGAIQKNNYSESDFKADIVTMFIKSRIPSSRLVEISQKLLEFYDIEFDPELGWIEYYTESLTETLIEEINEFILMEKSHLTSKNVTSDTDVTLGK